MTTGDTSLPSIPPPPAPVMQPQIPEPSVFGSPQPEQSGLQSSLIAGPPPPGPGNNNYLQPGKKKASKWRIILILGFLGLLLVVAFLGIGVAVIALQQSDAEANVPWTAEIGQCYGNDESMEAVPCSGPHSFEVFSAVIFNYDMSYPGWFGRGLGNTVCDEEIEAFTGVSFFASDYSYAEIYPSEQDWVAGERWVPCVLFPDSRSVTSGSARGQG